MPEDQREGDFWLLAVTLRDWINIAGQKVQEFYYSLNGLLMCPEKSLLAYVKMKKIFM